jgi:hypothetical protein
VRDTAIGNVHVRQRSFVHRASAIVAGLLLLPSATGCYTNVPVWQGMPAPQSEITVGLTDRGRTTLAPQIGPGARHVTGRLLSVTDSAYVIRVSTVDYISSSSSGTWSGEEVTLPRDLVSGVTERRLSRSRSWLTAGIVIAALALTTTIAINGFGTDPGSTRPGDGGGQQQ